MARLDRTRLDRRKRNDMKKLLLIMTLIFLSAQLGFFYPGVCGAGALFVPSKTGDLDDWKNASPSAGQCAVWNATDSKWENENCPSGSGGGGSNVVASVDLTNQNAIIHYTTLYTVPANGFYLISCYTKVTQAAGTSSSLSDVYIEYTTEDGVVKQSGITSSTSGNSINTAMGGTLLVYAKAGTGILYETLDYASSGTPQMLYSLHLRAEAL